MLDIHQVCQAAYASKTATDKQTVSEWSSFQDTLQSLADEVQKAAPAEVFPAHQEKTPPPDLQQQQLQAITKVSYCFLCDFHGTHLPFGYCMSAR